MKWTNEPPKEPGYYWLDDGVCAPQVVAVHKHIINGKVLYIDGNEFDRDVDNQNCKWAGPIPEPEEEI